MSKKVLLIADDDEMNRTIIKRFLKNSFDILEAEDGQQTLEMLQNNQVDALLLDIIMPQLNGLEVLEQIQRGDAYRDVGILVATSTKEKTERKALALGADDVVSKPYDPVVIQKRLENIMLMKEAVIQKTLLMEHDMDTLQVNQNQTQLRLLEQSAGKLHQIAEIMLQNLDNQDLLAELAVDVRKEADGLMTLYHTGE